MRGTIPSIIELTYFVGDQDTKKRQKVTEWMLPEHAQQPTTENCASCHKVPINTLGEDSVHNRFRLVFEQAKRAKGTDRDRDEYLNLTRTLEESAEHEQAKRIIEVATEVHSRRWLAMKEAQGTESLQLAKEKLAEAEEALKAAEAQLEREKTKTGSVLQGWLWLGAQEDEQKRATERLNRDVRERYAVRLTAKLKEPSDIEFLRRVSLDIRGIPPTTVESNYFAADSDPKKREKLLSLLAASAKGTSREKFVQELLADPTVQDRWAELWKKRIEAEKERAALDELQVLSNDRLSRLLTELVSGKRSDGQILDALSLATMARFPTDTERKLILERVTTGGDRRAKWDEILRVLCTTTEAKSQAETLARRVK